MYQLVFFNLQAASSSLSSELPSIVDRRVVNSLKVFVLVQLQSKYFLIRIFTILAPIFDVIAVLVTGTVMCTLGAAKCSCIKFSCQHRSTSTHSKLLILPNTCSTVRPACFHTLHCRHLNVLHMNSHTVATSMSQSSAIVHLDYCHACIVLSLFANLTVIHRYTTVGSYRLPVAILPAKCDFIEPWQLEI